MACVLQPSLGEQTSLSVSRRPTHHPASHSTVPPCPTLPCLATIHLTSPHTSKAATTPPPGDCNCVWLFAWLTADVTDGCELSTRLNAVQLKVCKKGFIVGSVW
ncbi:hypothetical protein EmuJ_000430000 [Echinococcus multilocularis]|uniref:Uncharacterized protein n=1 Tax=Echinococcus multilocularis TaxID=6211 RepID=A0A068Y461_ECHMU|nr:hypothetical protein EmuJ_000430000 [Echinococcus multilocularis]